ncbi:hypothetical protein [Leptospira sp. GIMC2001]|uniref:hypothetical protein n=1 Tax=Leptospira sp. GIMC2001 TaxID=1513297 RepID=UPI002349D00B|nr:hypothetical protein [Leptospira sp. GIMC2001]WCL50979.1 hypothetical protein O4O04_09250 [Leptospira sp. GIMC2001]
MRTYLLKRERRVGDAETWRDFFNIQKKRLNLQRFNGYQTDKYTLLVRKLLSDFNNYFLKWQLKEVELCKSLSKSLTTEKRKKFKSIEGKAFHSLTLTTSYYRNNHQIENILWSKLNRGKFD